MSAGWCVGAGLIGAWRFLYQGREVSYSSVLDRSVNARREALYQSHGYVFLFAGDGGGLVLNGCRFDIDRWIDLVGEAKQVKREIAKIAADYDEHKRQAAMKSERAREDEKDGDDDESGERSEVSISDSDGNGEVSENEVEVLSVSTEKAEAEKRRRRRRVREESKRANDVDEVVKT